MHHQALHPEALSGKAWKPFDTAVTLLSPQLPAFPRPGTRSSSVPQRPLRAEILGCPVGCDACQCCSRPIGRRWGGAARWGARRRGWAGVHVGDVARCAVSGVRWGGGWLPARGPARRWEDGTSRAESRGAPASRLGGSWLPPGQGVLAPRCCPVARPGACGRRLPRPGVFLGVGTPLCLTRTPPKHPNCPFIALAAGFAALLRGLLREKASEEYARQIHPETVWVKLTATCVYTALTSRREQSRFGRDFDSLELFV